jgi:hypothetical protein
MVFIHNGEALTAAGGSSLLTGATVMRHWFMKTKKQL